VQAMSSSQNADSPETEEEHESAILFQSERL